MQSKNEIESHNDKQIKMLLWSVFAGSKGCINRVKIVLKIKQTPLNTNQISELLGLDYKVVERHLEILEKNNLVSKVGNRYSVTYFLSPLLESNLNLFDEVADKSKNCKDGSSLN
jgi:predicted transcriptional regulator